MLGQCWLATEEGIPAGLPGLHCYFVSPVMCEPPAWLVAPLLLPSQFAFTQSTAATDSPARAAARGYNVQIVDNLVRRNYDLQVGTECSAV